MTIKAWWVYGYFRMACIVLSGSSTLDNPNVVTKAEGRSWEVENERPKNIWRKLGMVGSSLKGPRARWCYKIWFEGWSNPKIWWLIVFFFLIHKIVLSFIFIKKKHKTLIYNIFAPFCGVLDACPNLGDQTKLGYSIFPHQAVQVSTRKFEGRFACS